MKWMSPVASRRSRSAFALIPSKESGKPQIGGAPTARGSRWRLPKGASACLTRTVLPSSSLNGMAIVIKRCMAPSLGIGPTLSGVEANFEMRREGAGPLQLAGAALGAAQPLAREQGPQCRRNLRLSQERTEADVQRRAEMHIFR